jgi:hypothetical protein
VATFSSVTRQHVLAAIAEYDARGADDFLAVYGFAPARGDELVHEGRRYDSTAILGVAHRYATGRLATPDEVHGGSSGAAEVLRRRGFEVASPAATVRDTPTARRSARAAGPARRANAAERPPAICPTCFTALPATGICDTCG